MSDHTQRAMNFITDVVRDVRRQNEWLVEQNKALIEQNKVLTESNAYLLRQDYKIKCIGEAVVELNARMDNEILKGTHVADSLIMLWGHVTANVKFQQQRDNPNPSYVFKPIDPSARIPSPPISPAAPVMGMKADEAAYGVTDLYCDEESLD